MHAKLLSCTTHNATKMYKRKLVSWQHLTILFKTGQIQHWKLYPVHYAESLCAVSCAPNTMQGLHILSSSIKTHPSFDIKSAKVILKHLIPDYRVDWFSLLVNLVLFHLLSFPESRLDADFYLSLSFDGRSIGQLRDSSVGVM